MPRQILLCGNESSLIQTRQLVLAQGGFSVETTPTCQQIASMPESLDIELAVIGHSLNEEQQTFCSRAVRSKWPGAKILKLNKRAITMERLSATEFMSNSNDA